MKKHIKEAIDYSGLRPSERIDKKSETRLRDKSFPLARNKAFPDVKQGEIPSNFAELLASESFRNTIQKLKQYTGLEEIDSSQTTVYTLYSIFSRSYQKILEIESEHKEYLEDLAVDIIQREFGISSDDLELRPELITGAGVIRAKIDFEEIEINNKEAVTYFSNSKKHSDDLLRNVEAIDDATENFNLEVEKRRLVNSIIHGAARKGENLFHLLRDELNAIDPQLFNLYCIVMAYNRYTYWMYDIDHLQDLMSNGGSFTGIVKVIDKDDEEGGDEGDEGDEEYANEGSNLAVHAKATMFPVLLHELAKGVYDVLGMSSLPLGTAGELVVKKADDPRAEIWDLRLGEEIYSRIMKAYPKELFDEQKRYLQHFLTQRFFSLPANDFLALAKLLLSGSASGTNMLQSMVNEIVENLKQYESAEDPEENKFTGFDFDDDDDDLSSI